MGCPGAARGPPHGGGGLAGGIAAQGGSVRLAPTATTPIETSAPAATRAAAAIVSLVMAMARMTVVVRAAAG